jgi:hypothetical protein
MSHGLALVARLAVAVARAVDSYRNHSLLCLFDQPHDDSFACAGAAGTVLHAGRWPSRRFCRSAPFALTPPTDDTPD